ncbi:MAG: TIGR04283 family arsenosugar biosynthesis glycosyltransferase [Burkholderiales bacterium]
MAASRPLLSVIIPVLNEAAVLPFTLASLARLSTRQVQLIVVDGGSTDQSLAIARQHGVMALTSARGRARQMNYGAAHASGEVLLFLHADTQLPDAADQLVLQALHQAAPQAPLWGRFNVRIDSRLPLLRLVSAMMNLRSRLTGISTGDQAMFMTTDVFRAVGGFPDQPLMEDIELSRRLRALSAPACLAQAVITSGRRWEQYGVWHTVFLMWRLRWAYWRGIPAQELARIYH